MPSAGVRIQIDRVLPIARNFLIVSPEEGRRDLWVVEHAERVMRHARSIAELPELQGEEADLGALATAALFHDAGWIVEFHQGRLAPANLLTRPTSDMQRELAAAILHEELKGVVPAEILRKASDAIRQCNNRQSELLEAQILAEAEALDEVGFLYVLRQFRQYQWEGRPLQHLVDSWARRKEYNYWEMRLQEGFRWEATRTAARQRLAEMDVMMAALSRDLAGGDLLPVRPSDTAELT